MNVDGVIIASQLAVKLIIGNPEGNKEKLRAKPIVTETETKFKIIVTTPKPKVWTSCYILCNMLGNELESSSHF